MDGWIDGGGGDGTVEFVATAGYII